MSTKFIVVCLTTMAILCVLTGCNADFGVPKDRIYESVSPTQKGTLLYKSSNGIQDSGGVVYVKDAFAPFSKMTELASGENLSYPDAVWSRDGTIVALKEYVSLPLSSEKRTSCGTVFVQAYDFQTHKLKVALDDNQKPLNIKMSHPCSEIWQHSKTVKVAIKQRGGEGKEVSDVDSNFYQISREVTSGDNIH